MTTTDAFNPPHCGLIFTDEHIKTARAHNDKPPFAPAWALLDTLEAPDDITAGLIAGWHYRLKGDVEAGERGADRLTDSLPNIPQAESPVVRYRAFFALSQMLELLRDVPTMARSGGMWMMTYRDFLHDLPAPPADDRIETAWHGVAQMAAGVVLEDQALFNAAVAVFKATIDEEIHPEGYFRTAVKVDPEARSLANQILGVQALVLLAEMASCAGVDLWRYENRGVSVITAATYSLYYYFYPEQWRWHGGDNNNAGKGVPMDVAKPLFQESAGFVEIIAGRYPKPLRAATMILRDLRPIFDPYGGGLVTLTHAQPEPETRRRRWFFF